MNRKQRRHPGKAQGLSYADRLSRQRAVELAAREATMSTAVQIKADIQAQRMLWLACVAMNDAFGIGAERFRRFSECLDERTEWYSTMAKETDEEYANEKLRQEAERCSGIEIKYLYEEQAQRGKDYMERMVKNNYQRLRIMTREQMARCIAEEILELDGAMLELAVSKWSRWLAEETEIRRVETDEHTGRV
jgi:hypothetical protein